MGIALIVLAAACAGSAPPVAESVASAPQPNTGPYGSTGSIPGADTGPATGPATGPGTAPGMLQATVPPAENTGGTIVISGGPNVGTEGPGLVIETTSTRPLRPSTTPPPRLGSVTRPYAVGALQTTFTDTNRRAGSNPFRTLRTTIWYPADGDPGERGGNLPAAGGTFPLVLFVHGWSAAAADYAPLLMDVAAAGYVVAAADHPLTSRVNGSINEQDTFNQPADLSFMITQLQGSFNQSGPLAGRVWSGSVGAMGQSDGAMTVMGLALNECCFDYRVGGVVALSGKVTGWQNGWFPPQTSPVLAVHGTNDRINPYPNGQYLFGQSSPGSALLTVNGGDHQNIFTNGAAVPTIARVTVAFLDQTLRSDGAARNKMNSDGSTEGFGITFK